MRIKQTIKDCLNKIKEKTELNAVIGINPDAFSIARALSKKQGFGAISGVPILTKGNISTINHLKKGA